jgi:CRP-like cAMP-binding protein
MNESIKQIIESHPFFATMKPAYVKIIEKGATKAVFSPGELLFVEGEPANRFFVITDGCVALEAHEPADGTVVLQRLGPGDVLGWSWLFAPFVWHFRAKAIDSVKVLSLNAAHLLVCAERNHDFGYELMKRLAQVIIQRLQTTRKQLLTYRLEASMFEERLHS